MSTKIFTLKFPFEFAGTTYTEFTLRRPKVRDFRSFARNIEKAPLTAMEEVIGDLCEMDNAVIAEIDIDDWAPMKDYFEEFLAKLSKKTED